MFKRTLRSRLRTAVWRMLSDTGRQTPRSYQRTAATRQLLEALDSWDGAGPHPRCFGISPNASLLASSAEYRSYALRLSEQPAEPLLHEDNLDGDALELAFAYTILRDPRLLEASLAQVERILRAKTWVWHRNLQIDLHSCMLTSSLALVYDLLFSDLSAPQRDAIISGLLQRDLSHYERVVNAGSDWWTDCRMNWQAVVHGHIGIAAMALGERLPNSRRILAAATAGVLGFLDSQPADGSCPEGLQYWHFGVGEAVWFGIALRAATQGKVNLADHPYLRATGEFARHMSTPDGCFDFEDCCNFRADDWLAAALSLDSVAPFDFENRPFRKVGAPARAMRHIVALQSPLLPVQPDAASTSRYFAGTGTVCMRSAWEADATFVAFHAGRTGVPHGHLDTGSFIIGSRGRRLIPDAGFWPYGHGFFDFRGARWDYDGASAAGHNVLLVDGHGPRYSTRSAGNLLSVDLDSACHRIVCDLSSAYGRELVRYVRYFVFLPPGRVVILDDVEGCGAHYYKSQFQVAGSATMGDGRVDIQNGPASASLLFCNPDKQSGYRMTEETRVSCYVPSVDDDPGQSPSVRTVSIGSLHRQTSWLLATVVSIGETASNDVQFSMETQKIARFVFTDQSGQSEIRIDLPSRAIKFEKL